MTEEVKKRIDYYINRFETAAGMIGAKHGCIFGYSLASEEIARLKGLLNELYMDYAVLGSAPGTDLNEMWLKYKQKHNL